MAVESTEEADSDSGDIFSGAVAAVLPGRGADKKKKTPNCPSVPAAATKQSSTPFNCFNHCRWGKEAWECAYPKHCKFVGNGKAGGH